MKNFLILFAIATALFIASCVSEYENIDKYSGEVVYPAAFDTILVKVGYERVEIDLWKAGRLSASQMKLGKAVRTIVEYDDKKYPIDSICSWVDVKNLTQAKLYRIKVYTEDEYGNFSVPQSVAVIPFTSLDRDLMDFSPPRLTLSSSNFVAEWSLATLNTVVMDFHGMSWTYKDGENQTQTGSSPAGKAPRFYAKGFNPASLATIDITYKVVPRLSDANGTRLLDTLYITRPLQVQLPDPSAPFSPSDRATLIANGITTFTAGAVASVTHLTYPMHASSFQDLFYFSNVNSLDLTGQGLPNILPSDDYAGGGIFSTVGGGNWQPFMRRVHKTADINISSVSSLTDLLESGQITKVRYITGTMALEDIFAPYVESGVVELVGYDDPLFPDEVYIEPQFWANGLAQDGNWRMNNFYSGDFLPRAGYSDIRKFDANNETVNGDKIDLALNQLTPSQQDGKNIYKSVMVGESASYFFALPKEYMFDSRVYRYLKFKLFCGTSRESMDNSPAFIAYSEPWIRFMNSLWSFGGYSNYGQDYWDVPSWSMGRIPLEDMQKNWKEYTVDMNANNWWGSDRDRPDNGTSNRRTKIIVFNIGNEPWWGFRYDQNNECVIYTADVRLCKSN